jgi:plasmid stabilization system protein ParE
MAFRVETTAKAKRDLDAILAWLQSQQAGGEAGLRWFQGLRNAVASLSETPRRCMLSPENEVFPFEVRQLLYGNRLHAYRILFTIEGDAVTVLHIRHGRRLPLSGG